MNYVKSLVLSLMLLSILSNAQNTVCLDIETNPNPTDPALSAFTKYIDVFGIGIYAESTISDAKVKHVAAIFAEWLDNDEDGVVDDMNVLSELTSRNALMPIFSQEGSAAENTFFNNYNGNGVGAVCYNFEIIPTRPLIGQFDATLEENLHTISSIGYANAYPSIFSEGRNSNSLMTQAMDVARGGHFVTIPNPYPAGAWYTYDDFTCSYECMATEYFYWGLTSKLDIQNYGNRCNQIDNEWLLCTQSQFENGDVLLNDLFTNPTGYVIPTNAPDGNYCPSTACGGTASIIGLPSSTSSSTPITLSANPPGGTFSGTGVIFSAFNPGIAGPGIHTITYNYTDENGCSYSANQDILVFSISYTFVNYNLGTIAPKITDDTELLIDAKEKGNYYINLYDVSGRTLHSQRISIQSGRQNTGIRPFKNLKRGVYIFTISNNAEMQSEKIYYTP